MSFIFRDPFFDGFDDYFMQSPFFSKKWLADDKDNKGKELKPRRDLITPLSGFGRMDVNENEKSYEIRVDVPGMDKSELKMSVENHCLVIEGERKEEKEEEDKTSKCHFSERHFGQFHREVSLPTNADVDNVAAVYENGVLKVSIPKKETTPAKKQITVN
ncbi:heat shock protein HSP20 [Blastocystis sp. subtype 4]|uniref:heat shock protein HSP20 n=1 Tax=Blastocystis sp. subtype 4 TaxID=944170 RepID=UPI0007114471|nr:heat shock protein HSP20 [Blastocystis sp. subtype 4]KNB42457.1 heat shock protein HSP20 [Blastocystis sp. subtype 4]|eukprot:XP_014525900.1 heat shock protein HSP20 [Blastocystis sp. subtype 4]